MIHGAVNGEPLNLIPFNGSGAMPFRPLVLNKEHAAVLLPSDDPFGIDPAQTVLLSSDLDPFGVDPAQTRLIT
jgi:hypothetical protein